MAVVANARVHFSEQTIKTHTKFVQDVRYAPSGDHFASVGSDGKIFLYEGKAGETVGEFSGAHAGTAVSQARFLFHDRMLSLVSAIHIVVRVKLEP
jgi:WD40 repeat protein